MEAPTARCRQRRLRQSEEGPQCDPSDDTKSLRRRRSSEITEASARSITDPAAHRPMPCQPLVARGSSRARLAPAVLHACPMMVSFNQEATARETKKPLLVSLAAVLLFGMFSAASVTAQDAPQTPPSPSAPDQTAPAGGQSANLVTCSSQLGQRIQCAVDTSAGVALVRSRGAAPCLYGDTWGFDAAGIWVSDGCSGVFLIGGVAQVTGD